MRPIHPKNIKSDSVQTIVCEKMDELQTIPMDEDTSMVMIKFMLDKESKEKAEEVIEKIWQAMAMRSRMKGQFGREMDPRAAILIAMWAKSIGSCLLYMYYCHWKMNEKNIEGEFTMDHLVEFFPMGFFTEDDIHTIWDSQKVDNRTEHFDDLDNGITGGSDNLIDYSEASEGLGGVKAMEEKV